MNKHQHTDHYLSKQDKTDKIIALFQLVFI